MPRLHAAAAALVSAVLLLVAAPPASAAETLTIGVSSPADGSATNDLTPTLEGSGTARAVLDVELDGVVVAAATAVGSDGRWSWTPPQRLTQGGHRVRVTATAPGAEPVTTGVVRFTVDSVVPQPPTLREPVSPQPGLRPHVRGWAEGGSRIDLLVDGVPVGRTTTPGSTGYDAFEVAAREDLTLGRHVARVTATDAAGNTSAASNPVSVVVEGRRPTLGLRQGSVTNDQTPDVVGSATPDADVRVSLDGEVLTTVRAGADGSFGHPVLTPLGEGTHTLSAVTVEAGRVTSAEGTATVEIDLTPPRPPTVSTPAEGATVGARPEVSGNADDYESAPPVEVHLDGVHVGRAHWGSYDGIPHDWWDFAVTTPLAEGPHTLTVSTVDAAGNVSAQSPPRTFTVDTTPPAAPVLETPAEGATVPRAVLSGRTDGRATLTYRLDGGRAATPIPVEATGRFSRVLTVAAGAHQVVLTATLPTGVSATTTRAFTVDPTPPAAPTVDGSTSWTTGDSTPALAGGGEAGATVAVAVDGRAGVVTTQVGTDRRWSLALPGPLPEGRHVLVVTQADAAGNSSAGVSRTVTVDTVAPAAPVIVHPARGTRTPDRAPVVDGTAEPGAVVEVQVDGAAAGRVPVGESGVWRLTPVELAQGRHVVVAVQVDGAGHRSPAATSDVTVVDATAPQAPRVTSPADGAAVDDAAPVVRGTGEPGATVRASVVGFAARTVVVAPDGGWALPPGPALVPGEHTLRVDQVDEAGNVSPAVTVRFLVRAAAPSPGSSPSGPPAPGGSPTVSPGPGGGAPDVARPGAAPSAPAAPPGTASGQTGSGVSAGPSSSPAVLARTGGPSALVAGLAAVSLVAGGVLLRRGGRRR